MATQPDEMELLRKLIIHGHLNVPDRRALPGRQAKASLLYVAIEQVIKQYGWLPTDWRPDDFFSGGLMEYRLDGTCRIHWQSEVGLSRYESGGVQTFPSIRDAAEVWLPKFFGARDNIDGIPIDWTA
jgi:hypothetical protein